MKKESEMVPIPHDKFKLVKDVIIPYFIIHYMTLESRLGIRSLSILILGNMYVLLLYHHDFFANVDIDQRPSLEHAQ